MREFQISQIPVVENGDMVGSINEVAVMQLIFDHSDIVHAEVKDVMGAAVPVARRERRGRAARIKELSLGHARRRGAHEGKGDRRADQDGHHQLSVGDAKRALWILQPKRSTSAKTRIPATGATIVPIYQTSTYTQRAPGRASRFRLLAHASTRRGSRSNAVSRRSKMRKLRPVLRKRHGGDVSGA